MRKQWLRGALALVLAFALALPLLPAPALAERIEGEEILETVFSGEIWDNDALFEDYLIHLAPRRFSRGLMALNSAAESSGLTGIDLALYRELKKQIAEVAAGQRESTVLTCYLAQLDFENRFTAEQLGVSAVAADGKVSEEAKTAMRTLAMKNSSGIVNALLTDCPYELYWFNKTVAWNLGGSLRYTLNEDGETVSYSDAAYLTFSLKVASGYQGENNTTIDVELAQSAAGIAARAQTIVDKYAGQDPYDTLQSYREEICALTSYNKAAAAGGVSYGDPWQLIYVFDEDPATQVVCEGYAKAFQYLCDLTYGRDPDSASPVCRIVSGALWTGDTDVSQISFKTHGHMWNVVALEGKNYLVDVTNCDEEAAGRPELLFLKGRGGAEATGPYAYLVNGTRVNYVYAQNVSGVIDQFELWGEDALSLADKDYRLPASLYYITVQPEASSVILPDAGETASVACSATGWCRDSEGSSRSERVTETVDWSVSPAGGLSVQNGVLTIAPEAQAGTVTVTASYEKADGERITGQTRITLTRAPSRLTALELDPEPLTVPVLDPERGQPEDTATAEIRLTGRDQYGETVQGMVWSVPADTAGISVEGDVLTLTNQAPERFDLTGSLGERTVTRTVTLQKEPSAPAFVRLLRDGEPTSVDLWTIPAQGNDRYTYVSAVYDQYGDRMDETVTWSLTGNETVTQNQGIVTIPAEAAEADAVLTAAAGGRTAAVRLVLGKAGGSMGEGTETVTWSFNTDAQRITAAGEISPERPVLVADYKESGMCSLSVIVTPGGSAPVTDGSDTVKLFWVDREGTPLCENGVLDRQRITL